MADIKKEVLNNTTVELTGSDRLIECTLAECIVKIKQAKSSSIFWSKFIKCLITVQPKCKLQDWNGCYFDSCSFKGKYVDVRFGLDSEYRSGTMGLRNCDFSAATLHLCTFHNCTPADIKPPTWPHVTIFEPRKNAADFADLGSDPVLNFMHEVIKDKSDKIIAVTYHMPAYIKITLPGLIRLWKIKMLFPNAGDISHPEQTMMSLDQMRVALKTKPYVYL